MHWNLYILDSGPKDGTLSSFTALTIPNSVTVYQSIEKQDSPRNVANVKVTEMRGECDWVCFVLTFSIQINPYRVLGPS